MLVKVGEGEVIGGPRSHDSVSLLHAAGGERAGAGVRGGIPNPQQRFNTQSCKFVLRRKSKASEGQAPPLPDISNPMVLHAIVTTN